MKFGHRERWYIKNLIQCAKYFQTQYVFRKWFTVVIWYGYIYRDSKVNKMILLSFETYNLGIFFHMLPVNKWNSMLHWVDGKKTNIWRVKNGQQLSLNHSLNIISSLQRRRSYFKRLLKLYFCHSRWHNFLGYSKLRIMRYISLYQPSSNLKFFSLIKLK